MVKVVRLPDLKHKGDDLEQFIEQRKQTGSTIDAIEDELNRLADEAETIDSTGHLDAGDLVLVNLADVKTEPVEWLWPGRIAIGKLTLVAGDPGLGKSFLTLDIASRVSSGTPWPDDPSTPNTQGSVILLNVEDDLNDTVAPRLTAAGAVSSRIEAIKAVRRLENGKVREKMFNLELDLPQLEKAIKQTAGVRLIVIDPISAFTGNTDSHKNAEIRSLLAPLSDLAAKHKVAVLAVTHLNKNSAGPVMYRSMGSIAFTAAARAVWAVTKDKNDEQRRLLLPVKNNLALDGNGLAYNLEPSEIADIARVAWEAAPVEISAEEAFSGSQSTGRGSARDDAKDFLIEMLADGPVPSTEVFDQAAANGFSKNTLRRAAKELGVENKKHGHGGWVWQFRDGEEGDTCSNS